jgi:hypothetical protein
MIPMNEKQKKWLTIIPPMPADEFGAFIQRWREENKETLEGVDPDRFAVDVIRTKDGKSLRRLRMALS